MKTKGMSGVNIFVVMATIICVAGAQLLPVAPDDVDPGCMKNC